MDLVEPRKNIPMELFKIRCYGKVLVLLRSSAIAIIDFRTDQPKSARLKK